MASNNYNDSYSARLNVFNQSSINDMNCSHIWNHTIRDDNQHNKYYKQQQIRTQQDATFKLYATGDANMSGRIYVSLPSDLKITEEIKKQYNLWM